MTPERAASWSSGLAAAFHKSIIPGDYWVGRETIYHWFFRRAFAGRRWISARPFNESLCPVAFVLAAGQTVVQSELLG